LKEKIKQIIPQPIKDFRNKFNKDRQMKKIIKKDNERFSKYAFGPGELTYPQIEARLTKEYHSIEKGLSYDNLKLVFGKQVLKNVINIMRQYRKQNFPLDTHVYQTALSNLHKYIVVHQENDYDVEELERTFNQLKEGANFGDTGGVYYKTKEEILNSINHDFKDFSLSRHSIRDYSEEPVSNDLIIKALELATHTPSACNRQPWKVRIVEDPILKKFIQNNQNGNRGFGDYINKFLIITTDIQCYDRSRERNQANIDGGMFAMNLLYALHYYKIASIPLSASLSGEQEDNLRHKFEISESENFIMFIGIGNYTEKFKIAKSDRRAPRYIVF